MAGTYIRECNGMAARFSPPVDSELPSDLRGVVNEIGFRLYAESVKREQPLPSLSRETVEGCTRDALNHISRLRQLHRGPLEAPDNVAMQEAFVIAERLRLFFVQAGKPKPNIFPNFRGSGWLDACEGDALADGVLFEIKAGDRPFRSSDIRQLLCYCALNFASKDYEIADVCLVNPRLGRYITESVETLCLRMSGRPAVEVLSDVIQYVTEPAGRYAMT